MKKQKNTSASPVAGMPMEVEKPTETTPTPETEVKPQLGRPADPNSKRQKLLQERAVLREAGLLKRGRPVVEGCKRQETLAKREAKIASGATLQKGRPVDPTSKRQLELQAKAERAAQRAVVA